jgi:hypothetical protein
MKLLKKLNKYGWFLGILIAILLYLAVAGISWIITCGVIKLITLCFGWTFSWLWATGIWLVMYLLRSVFVNTSNK